MMEGRQIQSTRLATPDISTAQNIELERDVPYSEFKFIAAIQGVLDRIPRRLVVAIMTFLTMSVYYMISTNFNNLLVAMVAKHNTTENKDYGKRFEWNDEQQVKTLCAFHIGQLITVVPAGILAEKVGCRYLVGLGISMAGLTNLILPVAAEVGIEMVNFCRVIQGFCCGTISPSMQFTFSRWAPPREKNIFLWTTLGSMAGTTYTVLLCGAIIDRFQRYDVAFYITGSIAFLWGFFWIYMIVNTPREHPRISAKELKYITYHLDPLIERRFSMINFGSVFSSRRFWALFCLHTSQFNGLFIFISITPKYFSHILGSQLKIWQAAIPNICRITMALIFCIITDLMRRYNILSITTKRKVFVIFSHFVPGALLISLYYSGGSSLIVYSLALGFMGAAIVTNVTNIQDMAPNHAAQLYGLVSVFPLLVSVISRFLISDSLMKQDLERAWQLIFIMTGVMFLIGGVVFLILGTGKLQKWNFHRNSFQFSLFNKESHSES